MEESTVRRRLLLWEFRAKHLGWVLSMMGKSLTGVSQLCDQESLRTLSRVFASVVNGQP